jgi:tripartite-type tricarboxylate transporter receptor subunit TctC
LSWPASDGRFNQIPSGLPLQGYHQWPVRRDLQYVWKIDSLPAHLPHIQAGRLRALGVASRKRSDQLPDLRAKLAAIGIDIAGSTPEALQAEVLDEIAKWTKVIKDANIKQE